MKPFALIIIFLLLLSCGNKKSAIRNDPPKPGSHLPEIFKMTTDTQDAIFYLGYGYTGCGSGMPILDPATGDPRELQGCCICLDYDYTSTVESKVPGCISGNPEIKIVARIYLEQHLGYHSTEEENSYLFYEAKVVQLAHIFVNAEPCFL